MNSHFIYILASDSWTLYIWVTNNLERRLFEHKNELVEWFTKKYWCKKLIYFEEYNEIEQAIAREKQLKNWNRNKKEDLIKIINPWRKDLSIDFNI